MDVGAYMTRRSPLFSVGGPAPGKEGTHQGRGSVAASSISTKSMSWCRCRKRKTSATTVHLSVSHTLVCHTHLSDNGHDIHTL